MARLARVLDSYLAKNQQEGDGEGLLEEADRTSGTVASRGSKRCIDGPAGTSSGFLPYKESVIGGRGKLVGGNRLYQWHRRVEGIKTVYSWPGWHEFWIPNKGSAVGERGEWGT